MKTLLPLLLLACAPKAPEPRGLSLQPPADGDQGDAPMMSAYTSPAPDRLVVHVADTALQAEKTGWTGSQDLVTDLQIKTLDDGIGLFSRVELFMAPELEQYSYGLLGSSENVWIRINSGERELVLTLHPLDLVPAPIVSTEPEPDPGPPLDLEYWYVSVETLLEYLETEAGIWVYFEPELTMPTVALSVVGKNMAWRDVAGLMNSSLSEHGYALKIDGWSLMLHQSESAPETWADPPWADEADGRPGAPGSEEPAPEEGEEGAEEETEGEPG
jgi:hypothetical protein